MYTTSGYNSFGGGFAFENVLDQLYSIGFFNIALPFIIVYSLIYVLLKNSSLFSSSPNISKIISMSLAAYTVIFSPFAVYLMAMTAKLGVILIGILFILMIGTMAFSFKKDDNHKDGNPFINFLSGHSQAIIIFVFVVGGLMFASSGGLVIFFTYFGLPLYYLNGLFGFIIVIGVFWWMLSPSKEEEATQLFGQYQREMKEQNKNFGGGVSGYPHVFIGGQPGFQGQPTFDDWKKNR
ncbi:MAG: hypothetical protein K0B02_00020 [DPANN group archaeon]|nr:hypothetical protein [DPANN group archaeon]